MKTYTSKIMMEATSEEEFNKKLIALAILATKLKTPDLIKLSEVVSNPVTLLWAKGRLGIS
jgi:hypothetical protein